MHHAFSTFFSPSVARFWNIVTFQGSIFFQFVKIMIQFLIDRLGSRANQITSQMIPEVTGMEVNKI